MSNSQGSRRMDTSTVCREREAGAGFTLMELLITIAVLLAVVLIAIPNLTDFQLQANQNSAIESLRSIYEAEVSYAARYPARGFSCSLAELGGDAHSEKPTPERSELLGADLARGQKSGYTFQITDCSRRTIGKQQGEYVSFELTAVPRLLGKTGHNSYCMGRDQQIRFDPSGGTNCNRVLP